MSRYLSISRTQGGLIVWLSIGGRKPLAHLPRWKRHLFHVPSVRWRLWPRPFRRLAYNHRARYFANQMLMLHEKEPMCDA